MTPSRAVRANAASKSDSERASKNARTTSLLPVICELPAVETSTTCDIVSPGVSPWDEESRAMRIEVDWELCDGQGVCAELVPTLFQGTDDDQVHELDENPPASLEEAAAAAVRAWPKAALRAG